MGLIKIFCLNWAPVTLLKRGEEGILLLPHVGESLASLLSSADTHGAEGSLLLLGIGKCFSFLLGLH